MQPSQGHTTLGGDLPRGPRGPKLTAAVAQLSLSPPSLLVPVRALAECMQPYPLNLPTPYTRTLLHGRMLLKEVWAILSCGAPHVEYLPKAGPWQPQPEPWRCPLPGRCIRTYRLQWDVEVSLMRGAYRRAVQHAPCLMP